MKKIIIIFLLMTMVLSMNVFAEDDMETSEILFEVSSLSASENEIRPMLSAGKYYVSHTVASEIVTSSGHYSSVLGRQLYPGEIIYKAKVIYKYHPSVATNVPAEWEALMLEIDIFVIGILATATLTSVLVLIIHLVKLSTMPSHPIKRREAMMGILWAGIITAIIGGIDLFMGIIYATIFF